jgi:hypothetical protein
MSEPARGGPNDRDLLRIADELLEEVAEIKRQWAELARSVGAEVPRPERSDAVPLEAPEPADAGRLVAVEMMLSGRSEADVAAYLHEQFGPDRAEAILAEVYSRGAE